jgi:hypothetical protein
MKTIPIQQVGEALQPAEPIPETAIRVICDGKNYTVYEQGDELPPEAPATK